MSHRTIYWPDPSWTEVRERAKELGLSLSSYLRALAEVEQRSAKQAASRTDG